MVQKASPEREDNHVIICILQEQIRDWQEMFSTNLLFMSSTRRIRCPYCGSINTIKRDSRRSSPLLLQILFALSYARRTLITDRNKFVWFREPKEDLRNIIRLSIAVGSVTCDGAANILKAVRVVCPGAILQQCTAHIAREIESWITRKPQSQAARELLELR